MGLSSTLRGQYLRKRSLHRLLAQRTCSPTQPASSIYIRPGETGPFLEESGPEGRDWLVNLSQLGAAVAKSDTGIAGLRSGTEGFAILPPFPVLQNTLTPVWDTAPLFSLLEAEYTIGVVLLRLGRFAVAVYQGGQLVASRTDTRYVKGRHRAGGSSQRRFERIREGQIQRLYDRTCQAVQEQFAPYARELDYLLLGGERFTLDGFLKACPYLQQFHDIMLARRLIIREPKRDTLEEVADKLLESRVYQFQWNNSA